MPAVAEARFSTHVLSEEIGSLPHVKTVLVERNGDRLSVWTVVDDFSRSVRNAIYTAEARLIDEYNQFVRFDFHVIPGDETTRISQASPIAIGR
jgi:DNA-binding transcriptional regulator GbsR (MarR family)